jgi:hypothetical protein
MNLNQCIKLKSSTHEGEVLPFILIPFTQRGGRKKIISVDDAIFETHIKKPGTNGVLINAVAKAFYWSRLIDTGIVKSGSEIARKEGVEVSTVNELIRLTLLEPKIIESILNGTQPPELNIQWFTRNPLPAEWSKQRTLIYGSNKTEKGIDFEKKLQNLCSIKCIDSRLNARTSH